MEKGLARWPLRVQMRIQDGTSVRWVDALGTIQHDVTR
jgi:hypothetical protein